MPRQRGVSGFWLDIDSLDAARTQLIADMGSKEGTFAFGVWVRMFTWQYQTAQPIKDPAHLARLANIHIHTARSLWQSLPLSLPRSLIRSPHGLLCKRTMRVLDKVNKNQLYGGAQTAPLNSGDLDLDLDLDLVSSLSPSQDSRSGGFDNRPTGKKTKQKKVSPPEAAPPSCLPGLHVESWEAYLQHRRAIKAKVLKPASLERQMRWLANQGDASSQAAIVDYTVRNGYTGLFEQQAQKSNGKDKPSLVERLKASGWIDDGKTIEGELSEDD